MLICLLELQKQAKKNLYSLNPSALVLHKQLILLGSLGLTFVGPGQQRTALFYLHYFPSIVSQCRISNLAEEGFELFLLYKCNLKL